MINTVSGPDLPESFFRIDYRSNLQSSNPSRFRRLCASDADTWEELIHSIMNGEARDPDTGELVIFNMIVKIENVNRSVGL